jgi:hypothetical protein
LGSSPFFFLCFAVTSSSSSITSGLLQEQFIIPSLHLWLMGSCLLQVIYNTCTKVVAFARVVTMANLCIHYCILASKSWHRGCSTLYQSLLLCIKASCLHLMPLCRYGIVWGDQVAAYDTNDGAYWDIGVCRTNSSSTNGWMGVALPGCSLDSCPASCPLQEDISSCGYPGRVLCARFSGSGVL